jgi:2-polyprenyl-3-methyl-5-hydroxy-6-metoxy-1,4-benzoquinol methylase
VHLRVGARSKGSTLAFVYDMPVDPDAENNTHAYCVALVGHNKSVLELGCATGHVTKAMVDRGCKVVGIELDAAAATVAEAWAERVVAGDIDRGEVWDQIDDESFDVVLCGDVLEHLRDPLGALRSAVRKLKPDGYVVTSLPNVAHGDVRMLLLGGSFRYREVGLLDRTHLRFFTLETIRELLRGAGLLVVDTKRVVVPLFGTELEVNREGIPQATVDGILSDPEAETYQFVMKSVRDNGSQAVADLADRLGALTASSEIDRRDLQEASALNASLHEQVRRLRDHIDAMDGHVAGLENTIGHLQHALDESEQRYRALLATRSFRALAPLRRLYAGLRPSRPPDRPIGS